MAVKTSDKNLIKDLLTSVPDYTEKIRDDINPLETRPFACAVTTCRNAFITYERHLKAPFKFHNFPKDPQLAYKWLEACGVKDIKSSFASKHLKVCSDHFDLNDYIRNYKEEIFNPKFKRYLFKEAVPHHKLPKHSTAQSDPLDESKIKIISWEQANKHKKFSIPKNHQPSEPVEEIVIHVQSDEEEDAEELTVVDKELTEVDEELTEVDEELTEVDEELTEVDEELTEVDEKLTVVDEELIKLKEKKEQLQLDVFILKQKLLKLKRATLRKKAKKVANHRVYTLIEKGIFTRAQLMFLLRRKKVVWSDDDFAVAFNLRHSAGKPAYLYLKNELRWPLPSLRSVQIWAASD